MSARDAVQQALPDRPLLKPWYRISQAEERLALEYAQAVVILEGKAVRHLLPALLPLLDGTRTLDEIALRLGEAARPAIVSCVGLLAAKGLLTEGPPLDAGLPRPFAETATFLGAVARAALSPAEAHERLVSATVGLVGGGPPVESVARLLRLAGIERVERLGWEPAGEVDGLDLAVAAPTGEELPSLLAFNRVALAERVPWLQLLPFDGRMAAIGPLYVPGETSCYACFSLRRAANVEYGEDYVRLAREPGRYPLPLFLEEVVAGIGVRLALGWLVERDPVLAGAFYAFEHAETLALSHHVVYRVPRCPACSDAARQAPPLPWFR